MKNTQSDFKESDLYEHVKCFFTSLGYRVDAEVKGCDLTALKGDHLVIVELKKSFCLKLLYQAIDRQKITKDVYVCVPRPRKYDKTVRQGMLALVKKCGLGLITVAMDSPVKSVDVVVIPENEQMPKGRARAGLLLREIDGRHADLNIGGSNRVKVNTAYRERAVRIACTLEQAGDSSPASLVSKYGCPKDTWAIMYYNVYGWFVRVSKGVYGLSAHGRQALMDSAYAELVAHYRNTALSEKSF